MTEYTQLPDLIIRRQFLFKDNPSGAGVSVYQSNHEYWRFIATVPPIDVALLHEWLTDYLAAHPVES